MRDPVYPDHIRTALAESRRQAEARDRAARASAVTCGWCGQPITNGTTCCGPTPWQMQRNEYVSHTENER